MVSIALTKLGMSEEGKGEEVGGLRAITYVHTRKDKPSNLL